MEAREGLIEKDLIAFDGTIFQVLDLPLTPLKIPTPKEDPVHRGPIAQLIRESLKEVNHA